MVLHRMKKLTIKLYPSDIFLHMTMKRLVVHNFVLKHSGDVKRVFNTYRLVFFFGIALNDNNSEISYPSFVGDQFEKLPLRIGLSIIFG